MSIQVQTDRALVRAAARSTRYVVARITAPVVERGGGVAPRVNVALVLDRSGSMNGERKFALAREAVQQALSLLQPRDRFTLVVYDNEVDVLAASTPATPAAKREALAALSTVQPRGSTNLSGGWLTGCEQVAQFLREGTVTRVLLLTDGLANQGIRDRAELARHAAELRRRGVVTSTFGVGEDFDENLLGDMAHHGGGNFYFISDAQQIPTYLASELREALEVSVHSAELVVSAFEQSVEVLNRFRTRPATGDRSMVVELGDLASGQEVSVVLAVRFPLGMEGEETQLSLLVAGDGWSEPPRAALRWRYASHSANDRQPRLVEVDREVAALYVARARAEATEANRARRFDRARDVLTRTSRRIASYANGDPTLVRLANELDHELMDRLACAPASPMALKEEYFAFNAAAKSRSPDGRARR